MHLPPRGIDNRVHERIRLTIPVTIERPTSKRGEAETFDLSIWGALVLCSSEFEVGDDIRLAIPVPGGSDDETTIISGDVVRVLEIAPGYGPWSHAVALEFDTPLEEPWVPRLFRRASS
jgi:hypothetical protein